MTCKTEEVEKQTLTVRCILADLIGGDLLLEELLLLLLKSLDLILQSNLSPLYMGIVSHREEKHRHTCSAMIPVISLPVRL